MKKFVFSSLCFSLLVLSISSCAKKDYTCVCRSTVDGSILSTSLVSASSTSKATSECDDKESIYIADRCDIQN